MSEHASHDHAHDAHGHGGEHHEEHIHSVQHYVQVWAGLVVLFFISVAGPMVGIKLLTLITAFGIAIVKASMVVKFFMHLDVEKRFVHYFLATSLAFMFLFFAAVAPDVMKHQGTHWVNVAAQDTIEKELANVAPEGEHAGGAPAGGEH
jgi:caa(3)-type oxidase subunit IV